MERCKKQFFKNWSNYQCQNNAWKDGFCKIHHPDTVKARRDKSAKRWEEKWEKDKERTQKTENNKKDTERLDWCAEHLLECCGDEIGNHKIKWIGINRKTNWSYGKTFREAIDQAIKTTKETE